MLNCKQVEKVSSGITGGLTVFRGQRKAVFLLFVLAMVFSMAGAALGDLEGHWKFDETSGTSASDSSGNNNTGTLYYMSDPWVSGYLNNAIDFDGGDDYVNVPDSDSISVGNGDFTISAWIYPHTVSSSQAIVSKLNGTFQKEYDLALTSSGAIQFSIEDSGNDGEAETGAVVTASKWQKEKLQKML